jgi:hypothetical protein
MIPRRLLNARATPAQLALGRQTHELHESTLDGNAALVVDDHEDFRW